MTTAPAAALLTPELETWALGLLRASTLPLARNIGHVYLVEAGAVCFTSRGPDPTRELKARTGLLGHATGGPYIRKVIDGWHLPDATADTTGA